MSTSTLQLLPSASEIAQLDPASLDSIPPGVAYDLKRLKVYSSCLRCRAKKVKCDRKEPCSRCEKHNVECSYRELASVQLDIRQFQRHLNNPKIRKDGAGLLTATATPVITSSSTSATASSAMTGAFAAVAPVTPPSSSPMVFSSTSPSSLALGHSSNGHYSSTNSHSGSDYGTVSPSRSSPSSRSPSARNNYECPNPSACAAACATSDTESDGTMAAMTVHTSDRTAHTTEQARVYKVHRKKPSSKSLRVDPLESRSEIDNRMRMDIRDISDHVDRVQLSETSSHTTFTSSNSNRRMSSSDGEEEVPIWRAQAVGKHKQTVHEQDMADTFGLAAYLKAKEMEISQDPGRAGQTIDYEMELEQALAQRMPSSFSRPDRSYSSRAARRHRHEPPSGGPGCSHAVTPYSRPSHCQLSPPPSSSSNKSPATSKSYAQPPTSAQCCCQIAALQGQALGSCPYSNVSHSGYERPSLPALSSTSSTASSSSPQTTVLDHDEAPRIAYSPSYSPRYNHSDPHNDQDPKEATSGSVTPTNSYLPPQVKTSGWLSSAALTTYPSAMPGYGDSSPSTSPSSYSSSMRMEISSPSTELPPIHLPGGSSFSAPAYQVGRDGDEPIQIECKYNEPNVDAWDMIEKPISRTIPLTTKRGRSIKMEMGWILS